MTITPSRMLRPLREAIGNTTGQLPSLDEFRAECNRGQLKGAKRADRRFFSGDWLIAWLQDADAAEAQRDD